MQIGSYNTKKINSGSVTAKNVSFLGTLKNFVGSSANTDGGIDAKEVMMDLTAFIDDGIERVSEDISEGIVKGKEHLSIWHEQFKNTGARLYDSVESPIGKTLLNGLAWLGYNASRTGASIINTAVGFVQGLGEFAEALLDTSAIISTVINTPIYALADGINWLGSKIFGYEFHSFTKAVWGQTMDFVSTKYVSNAFDNFHQNTVIGKSLDEYAYTPFKSTGAAYKVADGVGYVGGIILLSLATAGIGGAAATGTGATAAGTSASASTLATLNVGQVATIEISKQSAINAGMAAFAGFGKNTQNAWSDGASLEEGLVYGGAMAAWEGGEMFLGSAINGLKFPGLSGVGGQLLTTGAHVTLDSIDSASSSFINPLMQMIYTPNDNNLAQIMYLINYDENGNQISNKTWEELTFMEKYDAMFRYNGGWTGVGVNALVGGTVSLLTEIPDIYKSVKTAKLDVTQPLPVIDEELIRTQEIPIIKDEELEITQEIPIIKQEPVVLSPELRSALDRLQTKSAINAAQMKKEILASIEGIDDPILKAKKLYNELSKRLNYSVNYMANDKNAIGHEIYNQVLSFDNLQSDSVICKGWSELYRELLLDAGFSDSQVKIVGGTNVGNHKWISIDLGKTSIVADATEILNGYTDLYSTKVGLPTQGFLIFDKSVGAPRLSTLYKNGNLTGESVTNWVKQFDEQLGYADVGGYEYEKILNAQEMFGNGDLAKELVSDPKAFAIDQILNGEIPKEMGALEAYVYYRTLIKNITGSSDGGGGTIIPTLYQTLDGSEGLTVVSIVDNGQSIYQVYSKSTGSIVIDSIEQFDEFISNFKFVR